MLVRKSRLRNNNLSCTHCFFFCCFSVTFLYQVVVEDWIALVWKVWAHPTCSFWILMSQTYTQVIWNCELLHSYNANLYGLVSPFQPPYAYNFQKVYFTFFYFHLRINHFGDGVIRACWYEVINSIRLRKTYTLCVPSHCKRGINWNRLPPEQGWSDLTSLEVVTDPDSRQCRSMHLEWGLDWDTGMRLD